jgi:predicted RNA-binding protein YlxR (DUF448 family)
MTVVAGRETLIAGVLAATDKLVQHAGRGDWLSADKTVADRKLLLEQLAQQTPQPGEHDFLRALREAAAESEAALAKMSQAERKK